MKEKIVEMLAEVGDELLTYSGENMLTDGVINSFELLELVSDLEDAFDIDIDASYVVEKYFGNKDKIIALMEMLLANDEEKE